MELTKFMKQLKFYRRVLTKQQYLILKGQAVSGDIFGAEKGLQTLLNRKRGYR